MLYTVWESEHYDMVTLTEGGTSPVDGTPDYVLLHRIEAADWNDAMRQHHELMGWVPYKPME